MTITEALKTKEGYIRLTYSKYDFTRWLVFGENYWFVYEHKFRAKKTVELIRTKSEEEAIQYLIK